MEFFSNWSLIISEKSVVTPNFLNPCQDLLSPRSFKPHKNIFALFIYLFIFFIMRIKTICMHSIRKQHRARIVTCGPSET